MIFFNFGVLIYLLTLEMHFNVSSIHHQLLDKDRIICMPNAIHSLIISAIEEYTLFLFRFVDKVPLTIINVFLYMSEPIDIYAVRKEFENILVYDI